MKTKILSKSCVKCGETDRSPSNGSCQPCNRARAERFRKANPEIASSRTAAWQRRNPDAGRNARYLRKYGISLPEYLRLVREQEGCCAGCGAEPFLGDKNLDVDHDHKTGKVRGLLCGDCNRAVGLLQDSSVVASRIVKYLNRYALTA